MKKAVILALFGLIFALPVHATVLGVGYGDLIKLQDDHNPATTSDKVIYYVDRDWHRRPFPNLSVFQSWYFDFLNVKEVSPTDMATFRIGKPITYRPGTRLVKIASVPKVYAVEPGGTLRWITSESIAKTLYGDDWSKRVDDVPESFFGSYQEGAPLTVPLWPTGSVVRRKSDGAMFVIDGLTKHPLSDDVRASLRIYPRQIIDTTDDLSEYADAEPLVAGDLNYIDTSEESHVETLPAPAVVFPETQQTLVPGKTSTLASFSVTTGMPIIIHGFTVTISGPLVDGTTPLFSNLHVVDESGNDMSGIQQLPDGAAGGRAAMTFTGAYTMLTNSTHVLSLVADVAATIPAGASYAVTIPRESLQLADGGNGDVLTRFWPLSFPSLSAVVGKATGN